MSKKISDLPVVITLTGVEAFEVNVGGVSKQCSGDTILARALHVEKLVLGHLDTPGGILAWVNPAGADIVITAVTVRVTAIPSGSAATAEFTIAPSAGTDPADPASVVVANTSINEVVGVGGQLDVAFTSVILAAGSVLRLSRYAGTSGAGAPPATGPTGQYAPGLSVYRNTTTGAFSLLVSATPNVDGINDDLVWALDPDGAAGLAGFAYISWHKAA